MSTILKALEEIEQRSPAAKSATTASSKYEQVPRARSFTPLLVVLTAGSLVGMVYFALRGAPPSASSPSAPPEPQRMAERMAPGSLPPVAPEARGPADAAAPVAVDTTARRVADTAPRTATDTTARAAVEAAPPAPAAPAAIEAAPPAREQVAAEEAPWGRVEKGPAIVPATASIASAAAPHAPSPPRVVAEPPPAPRAVAEPPASRAVVEPPPAALPRAEEPLQREAAVRPTRREPPAASVDRRSASAPSDGASGAEVEVMSIAYSANVGARSAALRIGGQTMTLHQGDSARGLEVQLILPKSVYLRRGRDIFAVDAKR